MPYTINLQPFTMDDFIGHTYDANAVFVTPRGLDPDTMSITMDCAVVNIDGVASVQVPNATFSITVIGITPLTTIGQIFASARALVLAYSTDFVAV